MTPCNPSAPTRRETARYYRGGPLVVSLYPGYLEIRAKGKRIRYAIDYAAVYECAAKLTARRLAAEKKEAKR